MTDVCVFPCEKMEIVKREVPGGGIEDVCIHCGRVVPPEAIMLVNRLNELNSSM